jgi:hypothetical protein
MIIARLIARREGSDGYKYRLGIQLVLEYDVASQGTTKRRRHGIEGLSILDPDYPLDRWYGLG